MQFRDRLYTNGCLNDMHRNCFHLRFICNKLVYKQFAYTFVLLLVLVVAQIVK